MLNFQEFSATFAIGAFALSIFFAQLYFFFGITILKKIGFSGENKSHFSLLYVAVAFFGIGLVAEDLSNRYVDTDKETPSWAKPLLAEMTLRRDSVLRKETLFLQVPSEGRNRFEYSAIALELAERKFFSIYCAEHDHIDALKLEKEIREAARNGRDDIVIEMSDRFVSRVSNQVYYVAKNTSMQDYGAELSQIQLRIDFARSIAIISAGHTNLALVLLIIQFCLAALKMAKSTSDVEYLPFFCIPSLHVIPGVDPTKLNQQGFKIGWLILVGRGAAFIGLLLGFFFLTRIAYEEEEKEFDKRAFGYFVTLDKGSIPNLEANESGPISAISNQDISGMAYFEPSTYLLAHDSKSFEQTPKLSVLSFRALRPHTDAVSMDWGQVQEGGSDIEAVCRDSNSTLSFWIAESGYYDGRFGRVMKITLKGGKSSGWSGCVDESFFLPKKSRGD